MKTKLSFLSVLLTFLAVVPALQGGVDNTARACRQNINKWEGKTVSIEVLFLNPKDTTGSLPNDAVVALAYTLDDKHMTFGGVLPVLFQKREGERALRRYGVTADFGGGVRSRALRGILTRIPREGKTNLIYLDCSDSGPYADYIKPFLAPVLETLPEDVEDPMRVITPPTPTVIIVPGGPPPPPPPKPGAPDKPDSPDKPKPPPPTSTSSSNTSSTLSAPKVKASGGGITVQGGSRVNLQGLTGK